jgi:hypothetical protein
MRESEGVHWLAEYVVYQEMPNEADATGLSAAIDRVFEPAIVDRELRSLAAIAYRERVPWRGLLGSRSMIVLRNAANAVEDEKS